MNPNKEVDKKKMTLDIYWKRL